MTHPKLDEILKKAGFEIETKTKWVKVDINCEFASSTQMTDSLTEYWCGSEKIGGYRGNCSPYDPFSVFFIREDGVHKIIVEDVLGENKPKLTYQVKYSHRKECGSVKDEPTIIYEGTSVAKIVEAIKNSTLRPGK